MIKYEKGRNRPTENRAINSVISQEVDSWVKKIDEASAQYDVQYSIKKVAEVLTEMAIKIRANELDVEVMKGVMRRRNACASIKVTEELLRRIDSGTNSRQR